MKRKSLIIATVLLVAILLIGLGYAALTSLTLNISGDVAANPDDANFTVQFSSADAPVVSDSDNVQASINPSDPKKATIHVEGLTAKGDTATATYTIENKSNDLTASLSAKTTNSNTEYFDVSYAFDSTSLKKLSKTTVTVTIELLKTPVQDTENSDIGLEITATPVQPE